MYAGRLRSLLFVLRSPYGVRGAVGEEIWASRCALRSRHLVRKR